MQTYSGGVYHHNGACILPENEMLSTPKTINNKARNFKFVAFFNQHVSSFFYCRQYDI